MPDGKYSIGVNIILLGSIIGKQTLIMGTPFFFSLPSYILFLIIFFVIILFNWLGHRYKKRQIEKHPTLKQRSMGSVEGSMLGLMSLLLGFTFSVAVSKLEEQRHLIVEEVNNICTGILRCDVYPDSISNPLRADFKEYLETRIAYYHAQYDEDKINNEIKKGEEISGRIWKRVTFFSKDPELRIRSQQMITVLNDMINSVTTRDAARISRVPPLIMWTLLILVVTAAFLLGTEFNGLKRNTGLLLGYALVMTLTLNLIAELNRPLEGFIHLNEVEKKMENLRRLVP